MNKYTNVGDNKQKDNYMEDDFIGTTFDTPKGGVLTVIGWDGERIGTGNKKYTVECSVCSKDKELFPDSFKSTKSNLVKGTSPCGCTSCPQWSEYQQKVRVQRVCEKLGYIFHGWVGEFKKSMTKLILENPSTGNTWDTTTINKFIVGSIDPIERNEKVSKVKTVDSNTHIEDFYKAGFTKDYKFTRIPKEVGGGRSSRRWNYTCPLCSSDEYVKAGVCSGVFTSHVSGLKKGVKSCRCSIKPLWTQEQREYQIQKICKEEGLTFLGWEDENIGYKNNRSKFKWICVKGHTFKSGVQDFLGCGSRCNICAREKLKEQGVGYGYYSERPQEPDSLYILNFNNQYIKVGRSFQMDTRVKQLERLSGISNIEILQIVNGAHQDIYDLEQFLHSELRDRGFEYETDWGSTECFDSDSLKLVYKLIDEEISDSGNTLEIIKL